MKAILAIGKSNIIGTSSNTLPWHKRDDLMRFKQLTLDQSVVMGYNTYISLGRSAGLPNRENYILTSKTVPFTVNKISSINEIKPEWWCIGGSQLIQSCLNSITEFHVTRVLDFIPDENHEYIKLNFELWDIEKFCENYNFHIQSKLIHGDDLEFITLIKK